MSWARSVGSGHEPSSRFQPFVQHVRVTVPRYLVVVAVGRRVSVTQFCWVEVWGG